jgi:hypothetical protein
VTVSGGANGKPGASPADAYAGNGGAGGGGGDGGYFANGGYGGSGGKYGAGAGGGGSGYNGTPGTGGAGGNGYTLVEWVPTAPPTYSASGTAGSGTSSGSAITSSFTAAAGADIFLAVSYDRTGSLSSVTYGGVAMTLVGSQNNANTAADGTTALYWLAGAGTGSAKTVSFTISAITWYHSLPFSITNVNSVGAAQTVSGSGTALSQVMSATPYQRIVQVFGSGSGGTGPGTLSGISGGINHYGNANTGNILTVSTSLGAATFTAHTSSSQGWAGVAAVLS